MTLTEIRTEIRNITGVDDTSVVADSVLTDLINKGQNLLADEANLFYGYATSNTTASNGVVRLTYALFNGNGVTDLDLWEVYENSGAPGGGSAIPNLIRIYRADLDDEKMTRIGMDQIHNISSDNASLHMPSAYGYYIDDINIGIFPRPPLGKKIKLYYYHLPTTLSGSSDVPMLDARYHECLVYYGSWKVAERLRDINLIPYFKNEWNEWKEKIVLDRQRRAGEPKFNINYKDF